MAAEGLGEGAHMRMGNVKRKSKLERHDQEEVHCDYAPRMNRGILYTNHTC